MTRQNEIQKPRAPRAVRARRIRSPDPQEIHLVRRRLDTPVEIAAGGLPRARLTAAIHGAFAAVERVHALMSQRAEDSDVSRLNRQAALGAVGVHAWTYAVLEEALFLSRLSDGAFDISVPVRTASSGSAPRQGGQTAPRAACWRDIELLPGRRVRFRRPLAIDLGGLEQGFAVDQAVESLQASGAASGLVNTGGRLRVFGRHSRQIHMRRPGASASLLPLCCILEESVATTAPCFSLRRPGGRDAGRSVPPCAACPLMASVNVSVRAPLCLHADALARMVLARPEAAAAALLACHARAFLLSAPCAAGMDA